ncbi:retrovirus-related pol polyprotein from transposon TNT 1-94 [Tanacetum coccineum]
MLGITLEYLRMDVYRSDGLEKLIDECYLSLSIDAVYGARHGQETKHAEFDESNTHVLERFYTSVGNPVKEILLKLNLPDHRKLKDGGEVLKVMKFKKDALLKLFKIIKSRKIFLGGDLEPDEWIKDSGCSKHMTGNRKLISSYKAYNGGNVIFGSNLCGNIIGKGQICDNKCRVTFSKHDSEITKDGKVIVRASKELVRNLPKLKFDQHFCDACKIRKQAHDSHKAKNIVSTTRCLELLHMDLFCPSAIWSYGGNLYTLVIVDDYSRTDHDREFAYEVQFGEFCNANEPKNVNEALKDESWIIAMQEELNQFIANDVWELVPQPKNMTIIGTKWVYRNKLDENGVVSRNKARLVAQGYNQQEGIDYDETYAPVARLESIRILLAYACALDFKLFQMDVKSAFLNGFINEEVYVAQPPGFIDFEKPDHVYKLKKALYGLKQAPKAWYDRLKAFLIKHEYKMGMVDNTLFTKKKSSNLIIVQIYVDDIIFGSTCQDMCDDFAKIMHDEFEMSMMGELNFFLGLQIKQMVDVVSSL